MEEDYNFDMKEYEEEDQKTIVNSIYDKSNKPAITNLKSKFSCGQFELEALSTIKNEISKYGIKVASASNEIKDLWTFYGCCNEYWARIHDIFGTINIKEIDHIKKNCLILLTKYEKTGDIPYKVHRYLLFFRDKLYMLAQRINLGLEVEKQYSNIKKYEKGIVE